MDAISSAATSPLTIDSAFHDVDSRPSSPRLSASKDATSSGKFSATLDDSVSIKAVSPYADPITFDIKAHRLEAQSSLQEAIESQKNIRTQQQQTAEAFEKAPFFSWMFKVIPIYDFTQRTKLYNASIKAQIKFTQDSRLVRLQQTHVAYLDTLSKSELSPEEKHNAYKKFKETLADACEKRKSADTAKFLSVGCSTGVKKYYEKEDKALEKAASKAEQDVRKLLIDIRPHIESRHNIAQVLKYKELQLHHTPDKADSLKADMQSIVAFQQGGGFDDLSKSEAENFNKLFRDASKKYKIFQDQENPTQRSAAQKTFEAADALVMGEIRRLNDCQNLRKNLISIIQYQDRQLEALLQGNETKAKRFDIIGEKKIVMNLLEPGKIASLKPEERNGLLDLITTAKEKSRLLQKLQDERATAGSSSKITEEDIAQVQKTFEEAHQAVLAEIERLAPQAKAITSESDKSTFRIIPESQLRPGTEILEEEDLIRLSGASAGLSVPPKADLDALKTFAEKKRTSAQQGLASLTIGKSSPKEAIFKQQEISLTKLLSMLDESTTPPEKLASLKPLIDLMKDIEGKEEERASISEEKREDIQEEITILKNQFMSELEKISSAI